MGLELARAFVTVGANTGPASSAFQQLRSSAEQDMAAIGGSIQSMAADAVSSFGEIKSVILGITGAVALYGRSWIKTGVAAAESFEQTKIAFDTMLGSAEQTEDVLNKLTDFAAKTPFEMPEILQAARGLIQFGERGDELMDTLNMLGNAASGTSTQFGMVALIFNQIRGVGKLLTQDFRQLSTRGILSLQDIADHYKTTTSAAQQMLSTGKISFGDLREIMAGLSKEGGRFANLMERQSHSLGGLKSTLSDAKNIMLRTIAIPIAEWTKPFISGMIKVTEYVSAAVQQFPEFSAGALQGAVSIATLTGSLLAGSAAMKIFKISLRSLMIGTGIGAGIILLGAALGTLIGPAMRAKDALFEMKPIKDALATAGARLGEAWERLKVAASNVWAAVKPLIDQLLAMIGIDFSGMGDSVGGAMASAIDWVSNFVLKAATFIQKVTENWDGAWELMKATLTLAGSLIIDVFDNTMHNVIELAKAGWTAVSNSFMIMVRLTMDQIQNWWGLIKAVFNAIPPLASAVVNAIVQYFTGSLLLTADVFEKIPALAKAGFAGVKAVAETWVEQWRITLTTAWDVFKLVFENLPTLAKGAFLRMVAGVESLVAQFSKIPKLIELAVTGGNVAEAMAGMVMEVQGAMDKVWDETGAADVAGKIGDRLAKGAEDMAQSYIELPGKVKDAWDAEGGTQAVIDIGNAYANGLADTAKRIAEQFQRPELVDAMAQIGISSEKIMNTAIQGAQDLGAAFTDAFGNVDLKGLLQASGVTEDLAAQVVDLWDKFSDVPAMDLPALKEDEKKKKKEDEKKKDEEAAAKKEKEQTRFGLVEYGKKIQDMLLKKDDPMKQTAQEAVKHTGLLTDISKNLQDGILKGKGEAAGGAGAEKAAVPGKEEPKPVMTRRQQAAAALDERRKQIRESIEASQAEKKRAWAIAHGRDPDKKRSIGDPIQKIINDANRASEKLGTILKNHGLNPTGESGPDTVDNKVLGENVKQNQTLKNIETGITALVKKDMSWGLT